MRNASDAFCPKKKNRTGPHRVLSAIMRNIMTLRSPSPLIIVFLVAGLMTVTSAQAQMYVVTAASTMTIYGSANVTDWDASANTITGGIRMNNTDWSGWTEARAEWFESVEIAIRVEDIDSDSRRMNNNMHGYLKKDDYPLITYRLLETKELALLDNPGVKLTVRGVIAAAGTDKEIVHDVDVRINDTGGLVVSGSQDLKMTDFGIDPPTAVLGSIRSRDEMTIEFEIHFDQVP